MKVTILPAMHDKRISAEKVRFLPFNAATLKPIALCDIEGFSDWGKADGIAIDRGLTAYRAAKLAEKLSGDGGKVTALVRQALNDTAMARAFNDVEEKASEDAVASTELRNARRHLSNAVDVLRGSYKSIDTAFEFAYYLSIVCKGADGGKLTNDETQALADIYGKAEKGGFSFTDAEKEMLAKREAVGKAEAVKRVTGKAYTDARTAEEKAHSNFVRLTKWGNVSND